ncbi:YdeI/OmpD-associated family protein [Pseudoprimorskyibacter insulae]|uniref:YdhG-like domain-containing protein n=1 Tax=Pseudoprimorskyibacter insulae TaxID=1695997 RepID=A0A2R8APT0_9RHOB|nr:YdeI/OmpD-associated family protein [Pseudoprimorskyibacter insulae]SPF77864.1 hypothetical protein PRI8871_00451 [Pseudoprimorskyibacter insulae]
MTPHPKVDAYFAKETLWPDELKALRAIAMASPLVEDFKWHKPCYTFGGANVMLIAPLKEAAVVSFLKGVLIPDPTGLLTAPGENSRSARFAKFTSVAQVEASRDALIACIHAAIENEKAGKTVVFEKDDLAYPDELTEALENDSELQEAWDALTPGRRRGYVLNITQPKQSSTRTGRIAKWHSRILEGKGMHDR